MGGVDPSGIYYVVGKEESYLVGLDEVERFKFGVYSDHP